MASLAAFSIYIVLAGPTVLFRSWDSTVVSMQPYYVTSSLLVSNPINFLEKSIKFTKRYFAFSSILRVVLTMEKVARTR